MDLFAILLNRSTDILTLLSAPPITREPRPRPEQARVGPSPEQAVTLYRSGHSLQAIATQYETTRKTVRRRLAEAGELVRRGGPAALTSEQVSQLVDRYSTGSSLNQLSREFEVAQATVARALRKRGVHIRD